jgi:hypothetical protein
VLYHVIISKVEFKQFKGIALGRSSRIGKVERAGSVGEHGKHITHTYETEK